MRYLLNFMLGSLLITLQFACKKEETVDWVGTWDEIEMPGFAGTTHNFQFYQDGTFRLKSTSYTDAIDLNNPCKNGTTLYIKGKYQKSNSIVTLSGNMVDSTYTSPYINPCVSDRTYNATYSYKISNGYIILNADKKDEYKQIKLQKQ